MTCLKAKWLTRKSINKKKMKRSQKFSEILSPKSWPRTTYIYYSHRTEYTIQGANQRIDLRYRSIDYLNVLLTPCPQHSPHSLNSPSMVRKMHASSQNHADATSATSTATSQSLIPKAESIRQDQSLACHSWSPTP